MIWKRSVPSDKLHKYFHSFTSCVQFIDLPIFLYQVCLENTLLGTLGRFPEKPSFGNLNIEWSRFPKVELNKKCLREHSSIFSNGLSFILS